MTIRKVWIRSYRTPLPDAWPSAEGPTTERVGSILLLEEEGGWVGLGETAPWPGFGLETHASSVAALRGAAERLVGLPREAYLEAAADLPRLAPVAASPCARHAIDLALHDLAAQHANMSVARFLSGSGALTEVPVNAAIPRLSPDRTARGAMAAVASGVGTIKVKVGGGSLGEDVARVRAVREVAGPAVRIRVDANQAWSEIEAIQTLAELRRYDIEFCEQPVPADAIDALARVRAAAGVPIAADEAVRDLATARRILAAGAADILIVKPMALGGLQAAGAVAALAGEFGAAVVVTSLLESDIGRTGALHLAASLGPSRFAHGVASAERAFDGSRRVTSYPGGKARVPTEPGLGATLPAAFWSAAELVGSFAEEGA
ncbi:MAG: o-succinylbenzoate synthase [Candidatus Eisenbacteria bacterium]|uniref:o-succinylbenzoate synthase n=1 Tax=Eiseniibacteriota bacterium TaxID=2212470 RepID=A0A538TJL9_UNCEI|nr:MAG: o-succinylbenzoate synthase [Candidatus Eisenbacteria bacterium]